jgi:hypothetical protein
MIAIERARIPYREQTEHTPYQPSYRTSAATIAALVRAAAVLTLDGRTHDAILIMQHTEQLKAKHERALSFEGVNR